MKKIFLIITIALVGFLSGCEKEPETFQEMETANQTVELHQNIKTRSSTCCHEENMFERQLHWFSATTGRVLRFHPEARTEVLNLLSGTLNRTISAEALLGNNQTQTHFMNAFITEFNYYLNPGDPDEDNSRPTPPPVPPGAAPMGMSKSEVFNIYRSILLDENCVELYFPSGLDLSVPFNITSTAHPLTNATSNEGILRVYDYNATDPGGEKFTQQSATSFVVVSENYKEENMIIARPIRNNGSNFPQNPNCDYTEYNGITFTDFMDI